MSDKCDPAQQSVAYVTVRVPRNGAQPVFAEAVYNVNVKETDALGTDVITVTASDEDEVRRNRGRLLVYSIGKMKLEMNVGKMKLEMNVG